MNPQELTGKARSHILQFESPRFAAESETADAFFAMKAEARKAGIELAPFSAFRDFNAQLCIWNLKFAGERPLYGKDGNQLEHRELSQEEIVEAILCWSAVPGGSRHHWGTDIDLFDSAAVPKDYRIQLLPVEYDRGGVFHKLTRWLNGNMGKFDFFRPYESFRGGVFPEPWHLSYRPVAGKALAEMSVEILKKSIENSEMEGKAIVLGRIDDIFERYVVNICE